VVVLGGSSGIGLATAHLAYDAGADVTIVGRDRERLEQARATFAPSDAGAARVRSVAADVADRHALAAAFDELQKIDHVAFLAGEQPSGPATTIEHSLLARAVDARVWGVYNACALAVPKMPPTGSFVLCSGLSAHRPRAGRSPGAVATAALESLSRALAVELAPIRCNVICPGAIDTPLLDRVYAGDKHTTMQPFVQRIPLKRLGTADEVAHAISFLMTNSYVTGITLYVDGGATLV
jgi:NAD(P)-dependent dehydrogenase (short-subunit alcohol dehydrogenase family)